LKKEDDFIVFSSWIVVFKMLVVMNFGFSIGIISTRDQTMFPEFGSVIQ